jgi:aminoglycoside/choline kinase family phosphotransferase
MLRGVGGGAPRVKPPRFKTRLATREAPGNSPRHMTTDAARAAPAFNWPEIPGEPLKKGGSGRSFSRVTMPDNTRAILCTYDDSREENALYARLADFLADIGFSVPKVLARDDTSRRLLLEDLGETDLLSLANAPQTERLRAYRSALAALHRLHTEGLARWHEAGDARPRLMPGFDAALYRWEQDYFRDNTVRRLLPGSGDGSSSLLPDATAAAIRAELDALTLRLLRHPAQLVHRDCQSENILWRGGQAWFIDFQGMRIGSGFYDLGSLLWDPYVKFTSAEREELLEFYRNSGTDLPETEFRQRFLDASAQRLMQALGAYGFLGVVKGRVDFLAHTGPALENLAAVTAENPLLPALHGLVSALRT